MADYKYRTYGQTIANSASQVTLSPILNWTDSSSTSGSVTTSLSFLNYYSKTGLRQTVKATYVPSWAISWDANNRMTVTITAVMKSVTASSNGKSVPWPWHMIVRNKKGGTIAKQFDYSGSTSGTLSGQFSIATKSFTINPGATSSTNDMLWLSSYSVGYGSEGANNKYTDNFQYGLQFQNTRSWNYDTPTISSKSCGAGSAAGSAVLSITADFGATRPSSGGTIKFEFSRNSDFSTIDKTVTVSGSSRTYSGSTTVNGLNPNTRYYVRYTASNGSKSATTTCNFVTLATNTMSEAKATSTTTGTVKLAVQNGAGYYSPVTSVTYYKKCSASSWTRHSSTTSTAVKTITLTDLDDNTCYQVYTTTTTTAGTYSGNVVTFTTPEALLATAKYTSFTGVEQESGYWIDETICYTMESRRQPVNVKVYYRMKGDTDWVLGDEYDFSALTGNRCFVAEGLYPNLTEYETYIVTETEDGVWESDISTFVTPMMENPYNYLCDNLEYMVDLLCQAVTPLYTGNKTIYANPASKELCDPYSENPTLATLWSRLLRFASATTCVICDMSEFDFKAGEENQYYSAETGWTTISQEIEEDGELLVSSNAVKEYVEEQLHSVWHYHGAVDYLVGTYSELPTNAEEDETAIVAGTSKFYIYDGSSWSEGTGFELDNFSVWHINNASDTSFGKVEADSAYYYFEGTWNLLDADLTELENRVTALEDANLVQRQSETEDEIQIKVVTSTWMDSNYSTLASDSDSRTIYYVTEDIS